MPMSLEEIFHDLKVAVMRSDVFRCGSRAVASVDIGPE
jgi:hypothetical protein